MFAVPGRNACHGRNQYILDFSKKEVVDYIYEMMQKVLSEAPVSYVKWDMNCCMSEVYSSDMPAKYQGTVMHRYILGVYDLYERLISRFPHILFESCAVAVQDLIPECFIMHHRHGPVMIQTQ